MSKQRLPRKIEDYARVVFDCDGVLLDSNELKSEMMGSALGDEPAEHIAAFVAYHRATGGVSRYVKYRHYFTEMYPRDNCEKEIEAAINRYAALVREGLLNCATLPGVSALLNRLAAAGIPCFINSGGDEEELREVMTARGMAQRFTAIFGSPATKSENLGRIAAITNGMPALFIGDAKSDLDAAEADGLDFLFVSGISEWEDGPDYCRHNGLAQIDTLDRIADIEPV